ncbi:DUF883 family protein [Ramlibacter tataouinensis]|uniref:DUF883 domain-containing protein n=1 Tax=Ramlibacter tataouinensis (strain ATCC BAA-407 / DSM 14655 / LMG 21543 / TTB310) TaxID=365046 RepID=F5XWQ2_RAMTT|nr:DUF883 family protein [Ramlibacter tataouinensis]AEG94196.1 conserved hypothetical protein [Ramlibacter tataouinensis TTB310]
MIHRSPTLRARASATRSLADDASSAGGGALDSTREFAAQTLERAAEKMRDLRYGVADTASAAQRQMGHYASATTRYVTEQPVKAALIAAAVGALVAGAFLLSRRRGGRY